MGTGRAQPISSNVVDEGLSPSVQPMVGGGFVAGSNGKSIQVSSRAAPDVTSHATPEAFGQYVLVVREQVEARLGAWFEARAVEGRGLGPDVEAVSDGVRQLTMRGGKRLRAVLLAAAYDACEGKGGSQAVALVGAALELFQTYLLAHDDLMDRDDVRRGGPSLPALMRARFGGPLSDAMTILAGDLASAWAQRALFEAELPPVNLALAARELGRVHDQVIAGQVLDMRGAAGDAREVEAMHALKTGSYSVRGPVVMGAHLAGASEAQVAALTAFGEPLGVAFQLRDDVLGLFGDTAATGKPAGNDLREGKRSAPIVEALRDPRAEETLSRVLGHRGATDDDVRAAVAKIEACGVRARIEARIAELVTQSRAALDRAPFTDRGRALLEGAVDALTERRT
jgi:geranylgeranyl diphosphate synthase type I